MSQYPNSPSSTTLANLGVSASTCAISFVRIKYLKLSEDATWANVDSAGWSVGELSSGMTCACLPTLRPLLARYFPRLGGSTARTAPGSYGTGPTSSNYGSRKRRSCPEGESQEDICSVALRDVEKGFRPSGPGRDWAEISDDGQSDEVARTYSVGGGPRPSMKTECVGGSRGGGPTVPPKDRSGIEVACNIEVTSSRAAR